MVTWCPLAARTALFAGERGVWKCGAPCEPHLIVLMTGNPLGRLVMHACRGSWADQHSFGIIKLVALHSLKKHCMRALHVGAELVSCESSRLTAWQASGPWRAVV